MQALSTRGETYTSLCGLSYDRLRLISEKTFLCGCVYESTRLTEATPADERVQVFTSCERSWPVRS